MLSDMMVLKEAYKGKRKELLEIEKHLQVIVDIANRFDYQTVVNKLPEVAKMEKLFIKCFGFSNCSLNFYHAAPKIDVTPLFTNGEEDPDKIRKIEISKDVENYAIATVFKKIDSKAFKESGKVSLRGVTADPRFIRANINVCIDLIAYNNISAPELLATMLHELGHQLDASIYYNITQAAIQVGVVLDAKSTHLTKLLVLFYHMDPGSGEMVTKFNAAIENFITKYLPWMNAISKIATALQMSRNQIEWIHYFISGGFTVPPNLIPAVLMKWATVLPVTGYQKEKTADSFAAMNGYGPELISALTKLERQDNYPLSKVFDFVPVIGPNLRYVFHLRYCLIKTLFDYHPQYITRAAFLIKTMKKEMNNPNLSPGMKKELAKDISEAEEAIEKMIEITKDDNHKRVVLAIYNKFVFKVLKGYSDPRDLLPMASF